MNRAREAMRERDWETAAAAWEEARADLAERVSAEVLAGLARALRAGGRRDEAMEVVEEGRERFPNDRGLLIEDGRLSRTFYRRSAEDEEHYYKTRMLDVDARLRRHLAEGGAPGEVGVVLGDVNMALGRWSAAAALWGAIERHHPKRHVQACLKQAEAHRLAGDLRAAREALERATRDGDPPSDELRKELRRLTTSLGRWSGTELAGHARLRFALGDVADAQEQVRTALLLRGYAREQLALLEPVLDELGALMRGAAGEASGDTTAPERLDVPGRGPSHPPAEVVHVSGFLYSGSGAVFDFLRDRSQVHRPFADREVGFFKKNGNLAVLLDEGSRQPAAFPAAVTDVVLASVFGFGQSGRPLAGFLGDDDETLRLLSLRVARLVAALRIAWDASRSRDEPVPRDEVLGPVRDFVDDVFASNVPQPSLVALVNNAVIAHQLDRLELHSRGRGLAVYREPRDQYVSQLQESPYPLTCEPFVATMRERFEAFERLLEADRGRRIRAVCFERFVTEPDERRAVLDWLGLDSDTDAGGEAFDPERSAQNIGIHREFAEQADIDHVQSTLGPIYERLRG